MDTSSFAYEHALRNMLKYPASAVAMEGTHPVESKSTVFSSLMWLYHIFIRFTVGEEVATLVPDYKNTNFVSKFDRATRRLIKGDRLFLDMRKLKNQLYIDRLMFAGLSEGGKQEKLARTSPRGRIAIYGLRYWGTRLQARARLSCYDHGWWRMPAMSATADGMWEVQLAPS